MKVCTTISELGKELKPKKEKACPAVSSRPWAISMKVTVL